MARKNEVTDREIVASARVRMKIDRIKGVETPDWIVTVAMAGVPVDRQRMIRMRKEEGKKQS